ncbi:MAG TPA: RHS repeat-associated core domain-containing protein, partial [Blastocatellia bacterium]|nr:RHS repeat-associated core domain-containing protein [Blastocatellia bacterium]
TKADGTVKARYDYLPFGEELPTDKRPAGIGYGGSDGTKQKFTQKERDSESGLDYFLARYYSSAQGRFTSPDEFTGGPHEIFEFAEDASSNPTFYADVTNPQSLNKYQYCYNNPLQYTDPDGHKVIIPKKRLPGGSKGAALIATAQEMSATGNPIAAAAAVTLIVVGVGISVYGLLSIPAQPTATTPATTPSQAEPEAQPQPMPPPPPITKNWDRHSNRRPGKPERGDASRRPGRNPPGPSRGPNKWKGPWPPKPPPPKPPDPPPPRLPETPKPPALVALGDLQGLRRVGSAEV